jgi:hypothetical protein
MLFAGDLFGGHHDFDGTLNRSSMAPKSAQAESIEVNAAEARSRYLSWRVPVQLAV